MCFIHCGDVKFTSGVVPHSDRRILVSKHVGAGATTLGEVIMHPGAKLPLHTHKVEEVMVIVEGTAAATLGEETRTLTAGDVLLAPAGVKHKLATVGDSRMRFMFFYPAVEVESTIVE